MVKNKNCFYKFICFSSIKSIEELPKFDLENTLNDLPFIKEKINEIIKEKMYTNRRNINKRRNRKNKYNIKYKKIKLVLLYFK